MILGLEDRSWYYGNISNKINKSSLVIEKALECYKQGQKMGTGYALLVWVMYTQRLLVKVE